MLVATIGVLGRWEDATNLVINLVRGVLEVDLLLKDAVVLVELDTLCPVIERSGNVNFFSGMLPERSQWLVVRSEE